MQASVRAPPYRKPLIVRQTLHNRWVRIIFPHGDGAQSPLQMIGIDRYVWVGQEHLQAALTAHRVFQCLAQRAAGQQVRPVTLPVAPGPEGIDYRPAVLRPIVELVCTNQALLPQ